MYRIKPWEELTIQDDYMFKLIMGVKRICLSLLQSILHVEIADIHYLETEKSVDARYQGKGIRMDVYVRDDANTVYNIEMQVRMPEGKSLFKRTRYYQSMIDADLLETGADYDEKSLKLEYERSGFFDKLTTTTLRVLKPKNGIPRKGGLVFTRFVEEAENLVEKLKIKGVPVAIVTGDTPKSEREWIIEKFKSGELKVIANAQVLTTGFDYPELDTIIMARPTKSLALYYQCVGRAIRPFKGKDGWIIDLCGNYKRFGKVSDLKIDVEKPHSQLWCVKSNGKILTNRMF